MGKRPGVICSIKISNIEEVQTFRAEASGDEAYRFKKVPNCEYALYKTVPGSYVHVTEHVLMLLKILGFLQLIIDRCSMDAHLFTLKTDCPLLGIGDLLTKAWKDVGLKG